MATGGADWQRRSTIEYAGSSQVIYSNGSRTLTVVVDHGALGAGAEHAVTSAVLTGSATPTDASSTAGPPPSTTNTASDHGKDGSTFS